MAFLLRHGARSALALYRPPPSLRSASPRQLLPTMMIRGISGNLSAGAGAATIVGVTAACGMHSMTVSCDSSNNADPWVAYVDSASGRTYYHNAEAQQTVWETPAAALSTSSSPSSSGKQEHRRRQDAVVVVKAAVGFILGVGLGGSASLGLVIISGLGPWGPFVGSGVAFIPVWLGVYVLEWQKVLSPKVGSWFKTGFGCGYVGLASHTLQSWR